MDVKHLDIKTLDRLLHAAEREQQRRQQRRPVGDVRLLLQAAAAEEGYDLADVFPEFELAPAAREPDDARPTAQPSDAVAPSPEPTGSTSRSTTAGAVAEAETTARRITRSLAAIPHSDVVAVALDTLQSALDLQASWPAFHAGMEEASRRNWVHFRGNSHCVLTPEGARAAAE